MSWLVLAHRDYRLNRKSEWEKKFFVEWFEEGRNAQWFEDSWELVEKIMSSHRVTSIEFRAFLAYLFGNTYISNALGFMVRLYVTTLSWERCRDLWSLAKFSVELGNRLGNICINRLPLPPEETPNVADYVFVDWFADEEYIDEFFDNIQRGKRKEYFIFSDAAISLTYWFQNKEYSLTGRLIGFPPIPFERIAVGDWPFDKNGNLIAERAAGESVEAVKNSTGNTDDTESAMHNEQSEASGEPQQIDATAEASAPTNSTKAEAVTGDDISSWGKTQQPAGEPQQVEADAPASTQPTRRGRPKKPFSGLLMVEDRTKAMARLHTMIDGKQGKAVAVVIAVAIDKGILQQPTYKQLNDEFGNIGDKRLFSPKDAVFNVSSYSTPERAGIRKQLEDLS